MLVNRHKWWSDGNCEWCGWRRFRNKKESGQAGPFRYEHRGTKEIVKSLPECIAREKTRY